MTGKASIDFLILTQLLIQWRGHPAPNRTAISLHPIPEARKSLRVIIRTTNPMMGNQISKMRLKPKLMKNILDRDEQILGSRKRHTKWHHTKNWMNLEIITGISNPHNLREALILNLRIAPITSQVKISLSTTPVIQIYITIPMQTLHASSTIAIWIGALKVEITTRNSRTVGKQPTNISRRDRGQNNCLPNSTNQYYDDPRENGGYSRVLDNSNQYQDDRGLNSDKRNNRYTNDSNMGWQ